MKVTNNFLCFYCGICVCPDQCLKSPHDRDPVHPTQVCTTCYNSVYRPKRVLKPSAIVSKVLRCKFSDFSENELYNIWKLKYIEGHLFDCQDQGVERRLMAFQKMLNYKFYYHNDFLYFWRWGFQKNLCVPSVLVVVVIYAPRCPAIQCDTPIWIHFAHVVIINGVKSDLF